MSLAPKAVPPPCPLDALGIVIAVRQANPSWPTKNWYVYYVLMPYGIVGPLFKGEVLHLGDATTGLFRTH